MKLMTAVLTLAVAGLTACSTTVPTTMSTQAARPVPQASVTTFAHPEINEAASAYVSLFKESVEASLSQNRYNGDLAFRHLSAEACFDSRSSRLGAKELSANEKTALLLAHISADKLRAYETLARGHFTRVNGLETFSCETAGLKVDPTNVRY